MYGFLAVVPVMHASSDTIPFRIQFGASPDLGASPNLVAFSVRFGILLENVSRRTRVRTMPRSKFTRAIKKLTRHLTALCGAFSNNVGESCFQ